MTRDITVAALTIAHWSVVERLFASSDGVARCWCMWPLRSPGTHRPDSTSNRSAFRAILEAGESPGLIAIAQGRAVGWCALGPRSRYPQYADKAGRSTHWAIPCLYVEPAADRRRVAAALIDAAVRSARASAATAIEGPPPWWLPGGERAIAEAAATFETLGFEPIGEGARMPELVREL